MDMQDVLFLPIIKSVLPSSWHIEPFDLYTYSLPKLGHYIPAQGWKIFVTCQFFNAESVIRDAALSCIETETPFKFINSRFELATKVLGKFYPRAESGKAVVIYPSNTASCHTTLLSLAAALDGVKAPPVLSGRRFANAPVYYRYGANSAFIKDRALYMMRDPETHELVRDRINPWYEVPPWIDTDPFQPDLDVKADVASDTDIVLKDGQYAIQEAVYFSNSGGIYLAADTTTNDLCCIKEARPWIAPHPLSGEDAVSRLIRESELLKYTYAASARVVPRFIDYFMEDDHAFLVREYIDGETLADRKVRKPFNASELTTLMHALKAILELQGILGDRCLDLSPENVIFDGSTVKLIDLETDTDSGYIGEYRFGTQGFIPPRGVCPWRWGIQALLDFCSNNEKGASNLNAVV